MSIYEERIALVRNSFDEWEADALLVMSPYNRWWLTGFSGSAGEVMITRDAAHLATDGRYWSQAREQAPAYTVFEKSRDADWLEQFIKATAAPRTAIEGHHVTLDKYARFKKIEGIQWVALNQSVEPWRSVKSADEIAAIRAAAALADHAMGQVPELVRVGMSERQLSWELEKMLRENGADGMAFNIHVASGENTARPHHNPTDRQLNIGDILVVDMGAKLNGFYSDITRSFHIGAEPDDQFWHIYNTVLAAQENCLNNMRAGMTASEIDSLTRTVIADAGHADDYKHSTGHSIGLQVHETPILRESNTETIVEAGTAVTIEPGIYIDGWGGIRIEDLVVVTEDGVEFLSHCPKKPIIVASR